MDDYLRFALGQFPAFEVRNGTMLSAHNQLAEAIVREARASGLPVTGIGGSDSHTSRRHRHDVHGSSRLDTRRFPEEPEMPAAPRAGGRHGSAWREAREIYGVVGRYWASLAGVGRQDLSWRRRTLGLAFSAVTMPFEFTPLVVAALHKRDEAQRVTAYRREWEHQRTTRGTLGMAATRADFLLAPDAAEPRP